LYRLNTLEIGHFENLSTDKIGIFQSNFKKQQIFKNLFTFAIITII